MSEEVKRWPVLRAQVRLHDPDDIEAPAPMGAESLVTTRRTLNSDDEPVGVMMLFTAGPNHFSLRFDPVTASDLAAQLLSIARSIVYCQGVPHEQ